MAQDFIAAVDHAMIYEVGAFWNPNDPEVQQGLIDTREQRKKVGYVFIPADRGGETKYGVAQNANPSVNVRALTLDQARDVYFTNYWLKGKCDQLPYPLSLIHFDGCVNHGVGRQAKFLQRAAGVLEDGQIGPATLRAVSLVDPREMITRISNIRVKFYQAIVQNNPSQSIFLNGWMRRVNEVTQFTLSALR